MTDWNWFFASIAQAVGALVGVLIAFLIATITAARTRFDTSRATTRALLLDAERLRSELRVRPFLWYNQLSLSHLSRDVKALFTDKYGQPVPLRSVDEYLAEIRPHVFAPRSELTATISQAIQVEEEGRVAKKRELEEEKRKEEAERLAEEQRKKTHPFGLGHLGIDGYKLAPMPPSAFIRQEEATNARERRARVAEERRDLDNEFDAIQRLIVAATHHIRLIRAHLPAVQSRSEQSALAAKAIIVAGLLFAVGVVFPLMVTPVPTESSAFVSPLRYFQLTGKLGIAKALALTASSALFGWLLVALGRENERLSPNSQDVVDLSHWLELDSYSQYLAVGELELAEPPLKSG
jgi:hypothetical protein